MQKLKPIINGVILTLIGFITGALLMIAVNSTGHVISVVMMKPLAPMEIEG
jgi:hypothetical protein